MTTNIDFLLYLAHVCLEWKTSLKDAVEKIKTHILCSKHLTKIIHFIDNVEK